MGANGEWVQMGTGARRLGTMARRGAPCLCQVLEFGIQRFGLLVGLLNLNQQRTRRGCKVLQAPEFGSRAMGVGSDGGAQ